MVSEFLEAQVKAFSLAYIVCSFFHEAWRFLWRVWIPRAYEEHDRAKP